MEKTVVTIDTSGARLCAHRESMCGSVALYEQVWGDRGVSESWVCGQTWPQYITLTLLLDYSRVPSLSQLKEENRKMK